jgi:sugar phosphate permease
MKNPHEVLGLVVASAAVGQFLIGWLHHRQYKRTKTTTKFAPVHIWVGRIVIVAGIVNGFLLVHLVLARRCFSRTLAEPCCSHMANWYGCSRGFPLALSPTYYEYVLGGVTAAAVVALAAVFCFRYPWLSRRK